MSNGNVQNQVSQEPFSGFFSLINEWYKKLPDPFKVIAFFIVLIVAIIVLIGPKTVGGTIKFVDKYNTERSFSGQTIRIFVQANYFPFQTQSRGEFVLPIVNLFGGTSFKIDNPNVPDSEMTGKISVANTWSSYLGGKPLKITIKRDSIKVTLEELAMTEFLSPTALYAAELELPPTISNLSPQGPNDSMIEVELKSIITTFSTRAPEDWTQYTIDGDSLLNIADKLAIYDEIMKKYGIDLPVDVRSSFHNIKQLSKFIVNQKKILEYLTILNIPIPTTLYETLNVLPNDAKVVLKK